ncbi:exosortase B [Massilia sp. H6]|uniref:exosortase B n=1 Tax=Massilia sp. H6 TaxID=2970464 RepID=UPI0021685136|nr:exosortase B [Massilia sp. H6]UVW29927.1 exosortase B [Massilia sp. H6]
MDSAAPGIGRARQAADAPGAHRGALREWWPIYAGLAILFVPTFHRLFTGAWIGEEQGHGPIIFLLALWLIWRKWPQASAAATPPASSWIGWPVLAVGLVLHLLGRSQNILMFEVGSILAVMAAIVLLKFGGKTLGVLWFPFFFMLFMVPLPGELVAAVTMPMKMAVSWATEAILFGLGYPISRSGVVLQIGQYQLLVADACAGLQTLLTLEALGLFYLNLMRHPSAFRNIGLAILIIPISFAANVIRVITLTLITYYFGDAAGQGFLHGFAGMVLFVTALMLILAVDSGLQWWIGRRAAHHGDKGGGAGGAGGEGGQRGLRKAGRRPSIKEAT